ncbi:MAG: hypothetical protein ABF271_12830 [Abyssibacter sp.]|uniref:hypothetical protein n=1 Tax=Abyssibacter sp. TaxID=2320200 RepID=UPI00321AAA79
MSDAKPHLHAERGGMNHAQIRMCGNSVPPVWPEALVRANFAHEVALRGAALWVTEKLK